METAAIRGSERAFGEWKGMDQVRIPDKYWEFMEHFHFSLRGTLMDYIWYYLLV